MTLTSHRGSIIIAAAALLLPGLCQAQTTDSAQANPTPIDSAAVATSAVAPAPRAAIVPDSGCAEKRANVGAIRTGVAGAFVAGNVVLWHYFKKAWWSGQRAPHLFFHADWDQDFRDQDKFGHMFGGYHLTRLGHDALKYACVSEKKAEIASAAYAEFFQLQIEVFDGHYTKYGFSYADVLANTAGMTLAVAQERHPALRAIKPTISYHQTAALRNRANQSELRPSLDYSGQTYWFSTDVNSLLPDQYKKFWPSAVRLSVGHSITDWILSTNGKEVRAKRRILLSLDLDPEKLPGNNHLWKEIKHQLSYYHFPAPALQLTPTWNGIAWYR
jgi:hypothetical protein